jgi:hypothetical protein
MGARWYDPQLARWASADTIVPQASNPQSLNRYSYVYNNALRHTDPSGHCGGDANDPSNPDAGCWAKISQIQNDFTNVHIAPDRWTEQELGLLYGVLEGFLLRDAITAASITMIRAIEHPLGPGVGGETTLLPGGRGEYGITIFDSAWRFEPAMNEGSSLVREPLDFQGTIAHELTHVATNEHPEIVNSYTAEVSNHWDPHSPVGATYNFNQPGMTPKKKAAEMVSMTVATYMYEPRALGAGSLGNKLSSALGNSYGGVDWRYGWVEHQSMTLSGTGGIWPWPSSR